MRSINRSGSKNGWIPPSAWMSWCERQEICVGGLRKVIGFCGKLWTKAKYYMKKLTKEWVRKAEADLAVVKNILRVRPPLNDEICCHCQQAGEKYLKALLQELAISVPRTHNLLKLIDLLLPHDPTLRMLRRGAEVCENMQSIIVTPDFGPHRVKPGRPSGT